MAASSHTKRAADSMRHALLIPFALLISSIVSGVFSYSSTRQDLKTDLDDAIIALANKNARLWTQQDTVAAIKQMHIATKSPAIYKTNDIRLKNESFKDSIYFTLALADLNETVQDISGNRITSNSIMLLPTDETDGQAIVLQGFADCSTASLFSASDQTLPAALFILSLLSMTAISIRRKKNVPAPYSLNGVSLTPMQRKLTLMLLDAPGMKVGKEELCAVLWNNKYNAEESLYTLVRRTKQALSETGMEIICNRGDSYEIRFKN